MIVKREPTPTEVRRDRCAGGLTLSDPLIEGGTPRADPPGSDRRTPQEPNDENGAETVVAPSAAIAPGAAASRRPALVPTPPVYDAREIVDAGGKAEIQLDGQVYTLRITKQGKLLLTK